MRLKEEEEAQDRLGAFYYVLGNLHSKFRQCLSMIQLLGLVKIKEYGMECILKHLLNDFHKLEIVCYKILLSSCINVTLHHSGCTLRWNSTSTERLSYCLFCR